MSEQHQAAYLDSPQKSLRVGPADTPKPGVGEVLIKVRAVAINPVDWKIQDSESGYLVKTWPAILGEDAAGEVLAVGSGVTAFSTGQRVIVHSQALGTARYAQAAFQELLVSPQESVAPLPDAIGFKEGSVLPLSISTAAAGLFQSSHLGLDKPAVEVSVKGSESGRKVLVWGGSSSVGASAIQLAAAAGYEVVTTTSRQNFDFVKGLGASAAFDYHDSDVVADLVAELKKGEVAGVYDAIGLPDSETQAAKVLEQLGGGKIATVLPPPENLPSSVISKGLVALSIFGDFKDVGKAVWQDFLPAALKSGQFKSAPTAEVTGKGLSSLQDAIDKQKAGVSAKKIVVTL